MELRRAVEDSSLEVYYQPKYAADSLELTGGEALLRWFHPSRGQIATGEFIAVAEESGLIADIGKWALQRVCRDLARWRADGLAPPRIAVNVSGREFMHPEALLRISDTVAKANLSASLLELELTEGVLMRDAEAGRRSLLALKEFGFALAVDDFGTGYCSLNYLKRFPLDTLKIDRSFVADISDDPDDAAIVRAIIALGHSLSLKIVAEGVTTQAQLKLSAGRRLRCHPGISDESGNRRGRISQGCCATRRLRCAEFPPRLFATPDELPAGVRATDERRVAPCQLLRGALRTGVLIELFGELAALRSVCAYRLQIPVSAVHQVPRRRAERRGFETELRRRQGRKIIGAA